MSVAILTNDSPFQLMNVAVLPNSCRRFDLCTVAVFVVAVPTCHSYDLYPLDDCPPGSTATVPVIII